MQIDLTYLPQEDRMRLSLRGHADWLITRSLLLKLVSAWVEKIEAIELPAVGIPLGQRDIEQEHALSLEFDGPTTTQQPPPNPGSNALLLSEISLTLDALGTQLVMRGQTKETKLVLTRKESHLILEMLAKKARDVKWLDAVSWPLWLGVRS